MPQRKKKQPEFVSQLEAIRESGARYTFRLDPRLDLGKRHDGYLLAYTTDLLLMHGFDAFVPDGYSIRTLTTISNIHRPYSNDFFHNTCKSEHLLRGLSPSWKLDLSSMRTAIEGVQEHHRYLSLYEEFKPGEFFISYGRVVYFGESSLLIQRFDTSADWEEDLIEIFYEDIREVEFDTPYINMFAKYIDEPPEPDFSKYDLEDLGS